MPGWDNTDLRALRRIGVGLGAFQVIEVKENSVNDDAQAQLDAADMMANTPGFRPENNGFAPDEGWDGATPAASYPELPSNPHNHVYTWSPKLPDGSMLVIRANTAAELASAAEALVPVSGRLRAAWQSVAGGPAPAPQAPAPAPQGQPNWNPVTPPPNQPYPGQPAWQQAGAPQASGWAGGQQQGGGFARNAQQGGGQGNKPQPKTQPPGWYRTDKNSGPGADFWKSWREQNQQALKGKIQWGGASTFWVAPDVAAMVSGAGFVVVAA